MRKLSTGTETYADFTVITPFGRRMELDEPEKLKQPDGIFTAVDVPGVSRKVHANLGTAPSCGLRELIQTHPGISWRSGAAWRTCSRRHAESVYSVGSACPPEQLASSRLRGSRVNCFELCRCGSLLVRRRLAGAARLHCMRRLSHSVRLFLLCTLVGLDVTELQSQCTPLDRCVFGKSGIAGCPQGGKWRARTPTRAKEVQLDSGPVATQDRFTSCWCHTHQARMRSHRWFIHMGLQRSSLKEIEMGVVGSASKHEFV